MKFSDLKVELVFGLAGGGQGSEALLRLNSKDGDYLDLKNMVEKAPKAIECLEALKRILPEVKATHLECLHHESMLPYSVDLRMILTDIEAVLKVRT